MDPLLDQRSDSSSSQIQVSEAMERRGKEQGRQAGGFSLSFQLLHPLQRSMSTPTCYFTLLCLLFLSVFVLSLSCETAQFNLSQFSVNDSTIRAYGDAQFNEVNHSYVLNANSVATSTGSCGLLLYGRNDVRIQNIAAGTVASFSTSFTFEFRTPPQQLVWDDLNSSLTELGTYLAFSMNNNLNQAWVLSWAEQSGPCTLVLGDKSWFGVVFKTDYNIKKGQPSNNFIGITDNDNSPVFQAGSTYNLCGNKTHCSYLTNGGSFTAWIDFTPEHSLQVRLMNGSYPPEGKPLKPLFEYPNFKLPHDIGEYINLVLHGSSAINHIEVHEVSSWTFVMSTVEPKVTPLSQKNWVTPVFEVSGAIATLTMLSAISLWLRKHWKDRARSYPTGSHVFSYKELLKATRNFSESEKIGRGGFGTVYRASFGKTLVAVKRINYESKYAETTFLAEISSLGLIRHRNVVQLQGWCHEKDRLLLVYDYMPNGSLNEWLYRCSNNRGFRPILSWKLRYRILKEVATALEYLHTNCLQCILHRDIKSSNVMLDADFKAHLGDFGLARLMDHQRHDRTTMAAGTLGYMAPEMPYTGKATKESDVYSFGVLVLEVICGRQPLDLKAPEPEDIVLLYKVWRAQETGTLLRVADPRLLQTSPSLRSEFCHGGEPECSKETQPNTSHYHVSNNYNIPILTAEDDKAELEVEKMIKNLLHLGLLCCLPNPKVRPTMEQVVQILQQIDDTDNVDQVIKSMPPLPKIKPLGLYNSVEFSQTADSILLESLPVTLSSSSRIRSSIDEVRSFSKVLQNT